MFSCINHLRCRLGASLLFLAGLITSGAQASEGPPPLLHISTCHSPSGRYSLTVDPTRLHGGGPGSCRIERDRTLLWEGQLDFTLWEAAITDEGVAVGYGYTSGWRGFDGPDAGDFIVAMVNPDGAVRMIDRRSRRDSRALHMPPDPTALGCFLDQAHNRFIVRFGGSSDLSKGDERWECYSITEGRRLEDLLLSAPVKNEAGHWHLALSAIAIPETDLTLVIWSCTTWNPQQEGIRLSLVDAGVREVWHVERPAEFDKVEHFFPWDINSLNLVSTGTRSFAFRSPAEQVGLTYSLTPSDTEPGGWAVAEMARIPQPVPMNWRNIEPPALESITLEARGIVKLQGGHDACEAQPLGVHEFEFDSKSRIGLVTRPENEGFEFLLYGPDGRWEKSIPLAGPDWRGGMMPRAVCIENDSWLLLSCLLGEQTICRAFVLDATTGALSQLEHFESPRTFEQTIKASGGRFAILGDYSDNQVVVFDHTGKRQWSQADPVFSSQDIAFNSRGELGVLGGIRDQIAVFDSSGKHVRTIHLAATLGGKPNYVSGLECDADGGWILHDFNGNPCVYRIDADGKPLSKFTPRFEDGREFRLYGNVKRAPDGRLWTSDGTSLLRLTDAGVVDLVIGRAPDASSLGEIRCTTVDAAGNIYAVDAHNAFVHVFDSAGRPLRILKPLPTDFDTDSGLGAITVAGDGSVYPLPTFHSRQGRGYLKFNADGTRAGFQPRISGEVADEWLFRPGTLDRIVLGYERAFLVNAAGEKIRTLERRADRRWLGNPDSAAFAPDGSFIIITSFFGQRNAQAGVTLFSTSGEAIKTYDLPPSIGFPQGVTNGRTIVVTSNEAGVVIDIATGQMKQWQPPPELRKSWWHPFPSPDGSELWCIDQPARAMHRFAMP